MNERLAASKRAYFWHGVRRGYAGGFFLGSITGAIFFAVIAHYIWAGLFAVGAVLGAVTFYSERQVWRSREWRMRNG